jgi:hypothetical protein
VTRAANRVGDPGLQLHAAVVEGDGYAHGEGTLPL